MSTISFSIIIVVFVVLIFIAFTYQHNRQKKRTLSVLLSRLKKSGQGNNPSVSSHEFLTGAALSLDALKLKLLILQQDDENPYLGDIINLEMVKTCTLKKIYKPIHRYQSNDKRIENYLYKIVLHIEFIDRRESVTIDFYSHIANNLYEMQALENKARKWESTLLQMSGNTQRQIA